MGESVNLCFLHGPVSLISLRPDSGRPDDDK